MFLVYCIKESDVFGVLQASFFFPESTELIQKVVFDAEVECRNANPIQCASHLSVDESCCAQYSVDGSWNRACVKRVDQDHGKIEVGDKHIL